MEKTIEIPEGYEARIEGNKVILERKESEDERIREAIESIIRVYGKTQGEWIAGYDMDTLVVHLRDAFAYLERQKEQKPTTEEVLIRAGLKPFKDGNQWCILAGDNIQEGVCGFGDTIEDALYEFLKEVCEQQKPAEWSEEDEEMFAGIIADIKFTQRAHNHEVNQIVYEREIDWLKSLRDNYKNCNSRWKPSEEQMAALLNAEGLVRANNYPENAKILASLYTDLKKL